MVDIHTLQLPPELESQLKQIPSQIQNNESIKTFIYKRRNLVRALVTAKSNKDIQGFKTTLEEFRKLLVQEQQFAVEEQRRLEDLVTQLSSLLGSKVKGSKVLKQVLKKLNLALVVKPKEMVDVYFQMSKTLDSYISDLGSSNIEDLDTLYRQFKTLFLDAQIQLSEGFLKRKVNLKEKFEQNLMDINAILQSLQQDIDVELKKVQSTNITTNIGILASFGLMLLSNYGTILNFESGNFEHGVLMLGMFSIIGLSATLMLIVRNIEQNKFSINTFLS